MIELMTGLIGLMVLIAGLLQVASLTKARTDAMVEAREEAGRRALGNAALSQSADYIRDIEVGPDGRTYSYDDTHTRASGGPFHDIIVDRAVRNASQWQILEDANNKSFSALNNAGSPVATFGLVKGEAHRTIQLRPAVRSLIYRAEQINIQCDVWSTWTRGVY
jgi:hypothetical protein